MADQHDVLLEDLWFDKHNLPGELRVDKHVLRSGQTCLTCGSECWQACLTWWAELEELTCEGSYLRCWGLTNMKAYLRSGELTNMVLLEELRADKHGLTWGAEGWQTWGCRGSAWSPWPQRRMEQRREWESSTGLASSSSLTHPPLWPPWIQHHLCTQLPPVRHSPELPWSCRQSMYTLQVKRCVSFVKDIPYHAKVTHTCIQHSLSFSNSYWQGHSAKM